MNINDILLAQNIARWTIVSTIQKQSLAEHLFNVTMIARNIATEANMPDDKIIKYALDHDLDEIMTGAIPSPAKERMNLGSDYSGKSKQQCSEEEMIVVKAADLIDAWLFIKYNSHDRHGRQVRKYMERKINNFLESVRGSHPTLYEAIENSISMLEHGKFEIEERK